MIGRVLLGRYRIVRELAKGGMGVVYLARAEGAGGFVRPVVIKLVLPEHASDARFLGMFVREAKILSDLRHPSIVPVLDFGEEDGAYIMVLEYVRGYHLGQWNKYLHKLERTVPADVLLLLAMDVLDALHKAHGMVHPDGSSMHIVHRDVSPSNIMLDEEGRARLLDFGVARMRGGNVDYQTQIQTFVGKFTYSAPELFGGAEASPQSDLYSVGVVLHEMLFGRNAFSAPEDAQILNLVLNHQPDPVEGLRPDAPRGLDAVLRKALAKEPAQRFASAWDFASALRELQPAREGDVRARAAALVRADFGDAMAKALGLESLALRDQAWREVDTAIEAPERTIMLDIDTIGEGAPEPTPVGDPISHVRASATARPRAHTLRGPAAPALSTGHLPRLNVPLPPPAMAPRLVATQQVKVPSNRGLLAALLVVGCLAVTAIVLVLSDRAPSPAAAPPLVRVVGQAEPDPAQRALEAKALLAAQLAAVAAARTDALATHQAELDTCFSRKLRGREPPVVQLHFTVDPQGTPLDVEVLPTSIASTSLGRCLRSVGMKTSFAAADAETAFTLPATATVR